MTNFEFGKMLFVMSQTHRMAKGIAISFLERLALHPDDVERLTGVLNQTANYYGVHLVMAGYIHQDYMSLSTRCLLKLVQESLGNGCIGARQIIKDIDALLPKETVQVNVMSDMIH